MAEYTFVTRWRAAAPIERVYDLIVEPEAWPEWWRGVRSVKRLRDGDERGIGAIHEYAFRSRLPYTLTFRITVTEIERPRVLAGRSDGELRGIGRWSLERIADVEATAVTYRWEVATSKRWMNLLGPILRPAFEWNHDVIMEWGREGMARRLGAEVSPAAESAVRR